MRGATEMIWGGWGGVLMDHSIGGPIALIRVIRPIPLSASATSADAASRLLVVIMTMIVTQAVVHHRCVSDMTRIRGMMPHVGAMCTTQVVIGLVLRVVIGPVMSRLLRGEAEVAMVIVLIVM